MEYRHHVDQHMHPALSEGTTQNLAPIIELGINHEQQHQDLEARLVDAPCQSDLPIPKYPAIIEI